MKTILILILLLPQALWAAEKLEMNQGTTEFLAVGNPGFLKIRGKGKAPQGHFTIEEGYLSGEVTVDLDSLDTGMSLRNKHMKEKYLQVSKYPKAKLIIKKYKLDPQWSMQNPKTGELTIPAEVVIHGKSKPVNVKARIDDNAKVQSDFEVQITDFNIDIPSFMGVTVADKVKVEIESNLVAKNTDGK